MTARRVPLRSSLTILLMAALPAVHGPPPPVAEERVEAPGTAGVRKNGCAGSLSVEERIRCVETGLLTHHVVRGESPTLTIRGRLRFYGVPAVSVAVIDSGRIDWARAWGEVEAGSGVPADATTLFQAASISKPVAAAGALRLVEAGALSLDGDVNRWLRSWKVPENEFTADRAVTLRDLLGHSAGTTVSGFPGYAAGEPVPTPVQVLEGAPPANTGAVRVDTVPGSRFRYSGGGYTIVQFLIGEVTGRPFPAYMRESVIEPVGMRRSTFEQPLPEERADEAATGHRRDGTPIPGRFHTHPEMAAAGLWSTPSDLARFAIEIQRALAGEPGRIVSAETARRMVTPGIGGRYGLGLWIEEAGDTPWFFHGGANEGYQSTFWASVEGGHGLVIMTNADGGYDLAVEVARSIARVYGWPVFQPIERDVVSLPAGSLADLAGTYRVETDGEGPPIEIEVRLDEEGTLRATIPTIGWRDRTLRAESPTRFFFLENRGEIEFERDESGEGVALVIRELGEPARAVRR